MIDPNDIYREDIEGNIYYELPPNLDKLGDLLSMSSILKEIKKLEEGSTKVVDARVELGGDSAGRDAWTFTVILNNPKGSTWPTDDIWALRRKVNSIIVESDLQNPWYINFIPVRAS